MSLIDNDDIELGEIPHALKYDHPHQLSTLSNGIRVMTEPQKSKMSCIGVLIGAGSRHEKKTNSGEAHFLEHLHFKGTSKRTRFLIETDVENKGSQLNAYTSREYTLYHTLQFKEETGSSMDVLGDMLCNSLYERYYVELEKSTIWQELLATNDDNYETLMEHVYLNTYNGHQMGLPILGEIDNIHQISREMIVDFHQRMYYGDNMIIVATGSVNHDQIVDLA